MSCDESNKLSHMLASIALVRRMVSSVESSCCESEPQSAQMTYEEIISEYSEQNALKVIRQMTVKMDTCITNCMITASSDNVSMLI